MQTKFTWLLAIAVLCSLQGFAQSETTWNPTIKVKALVHARIEGSLTDSIDVQNKFVSDPVASNFRLRRIELRTDIKLNDKFSGVVRVQLPELKGSNVGKTIELAYMEYSWCNALKIRAGQFKLPYELDEQTSHEDLRMIDRGPTSSMFVSNNLASYQPGVMLFGTFMKDKHPLNYYLAAANGSDRGATYDNNSQKNYVARLEYDIIKGIRLGANAQAISLPDQTGNSFGADLSFAKNITPKTKLILEGEYIQGSNTNAFTKAVTADTTGAQFDIADYAMGGYFAQALFKINIEKSWCKTFEIGGKFENTDPNIIASDDNSDFTTITGNIGFTFLPDNDARLQLNVIHTNWATAVSPGGIDASNLFVMQFQLKI